MGGKRPDQHNIDPSEAGATDYKNLPQTGRGNSDHLDDSQHDKERLANSKLKSEGQPFLPDVPSPSAHANQGTRTDEVDRADSDTGKENPAA